MADIVAVHAGIGSVAELGDLHRALYELAADVATGRTGPWDPDVLVNPLTRGLLATVLSGGERLPSSRLRPIGDLSGSEWRVGSGPESVAVASEAGLAEEWAAAFAPLARAAGLTAPLRLLTTDDGPRFQSAFRLVSRGVELARASDPELLDDLLAHVEIVAVVDRATAGSLGSASTRDHPGLVVLPEPASAAEVAEALVHEGAHQKLFALAIVHDVLRPQSRTCPTHRPPWSPPATAWPLEQTLSAWHAYTCLSRFERRFRDVPAPDSLLGDAAGRAEHLAGVLLAGYGAYLGTAAHQLLATVCGRAPDQPCEPLGPLEDVESWAAEGRLLISRSPGGAQVPAAYLTSPPAIVWLDRTAASALRAGHMPG